MARTQDVLTGSYDLPMAVQSPPKENEGDRLARWRFEALVDLGLAPDEAITLIEIPDIVHAARKLVDQGCPPQLVASLLGD